MPESGLACGAAGPCHASHYVSCLPFSVQSSDDFMPATNGKPDSEPTCETRLPRSPGLACGAAGPCKQSPCLTLCHMPVLPLQSPDIACQACIDISMERQRSEPTCETRLPRGPGLACGAARPCKQSQCLTLCVICLPFSVQSSDELPCLHSSAMASQSLRTHL